MTPGIINYFIVGSCKALERNLIASKYSIEKFLYIIPRSIYRASMYNPAEQETIPELVGRFDKEIKGSLNVLLVLKIIEKNTRSYGYQIKKSVEIITGSTMKLNDSSLYTLLRSLESRYKVIQSEEDYPRVYYRLTPKGKEALSQLESYWDFIVNIISKALNNLENQHI